MIAVGSKNPAKLRAVQQVVDALQLELSVLGFDVPSGVRDQPMSDDECIQGAINRARKALQSAECESECKYGVGIEGGLQKIGDRWFESGWMAVINKSQEIGLGSSGRYELSDKIMQEIFGGKELGDVIDSVLGMSNLKHTQGAMGIVTNGHVPRDAAYVHGLMFAFGRFISDKRMW